MYQRRWRVVRFYTFAVFHFGSLLKTILDHLGIDFGVVLGSVFNHFSDRGGDQKINDLSYCFFQFLLDFGLQVVP